MQTKTNDDPLKKMTKSQKIGLVGNLLGGAAQFLPGGQFISQGINLATQGIQQNVAGKEAEAAAAEEAKRSSAASLVASNEDTMNSDPSILQKKALKPITSYYGEAKNLSSLAYKDSILMKTVSGVSTLAKMDPMYNGEPGYQKEDFNQFKNK